MLWCNCGRILCLIITVVISAAIADSIGISSRMSKSPWPPIVNDASFALLSTISMCVDSAVTPIIRAVVRSESKSGVNNVT